MIPYDEAVRARFLVFRTEALVNRYIIVKLRAYDYPLHCWARGYEFAVGIGLAYQSVPLFLSEGIIIAASYWGNLALVYLFVLLGAVPTILNILKNRENAGKIFQLR